jgi:multiple RNA-binding domain-containing protein 1
MSRLIVKNLPAKLSDAAFRKHFARKGQVTDAKIVRKPDGSSRKFGFIGYANSEDASAALTFFHRTYLFTSRIVVETAVAYGSTDLNRPWSRHSKGSSAYSRSHPEEAAAEASSARAERQNQKNQNSSDGSDGTGTHKDSAKSAKLSSFMQLMQPRGSGNVWDNDDSAAVATTTSAPTTKQPQKDQKNDDGDDGDSSDEDDYQELPTTRGAAFGSSNKKGGGSGSGSSDSDSDSDSDSSEDEDGADADANFLKSMVNPALDGKTGTASSAASKVVGSSDTMEDTSDTPQQDVDPRDDTSEDSTDVQSVGETGRLFIRNLPYSATEDDLRATFETYGDIAELHLPIDDTGQSRGYAFVLYVVPENAVRALSELDSTIWQGRLIHIMPARTQRTQDDDEDGANDDSKSSYKRDKLAKDRSRTNDNTTSNPIYLRTDTVVGALADRYGVKKSDILDRDASNMAVRVALGETQVIAETREFLVDQGVDTELLEAAGRGDKKIKRSKQIIMIKNLPYDTDPGDLRQMFARHGSLVRFVVPPSKVLAIVEFVEKKDASRAMGGLAYKKYKRVPLFLEWAPIKILSKPRKSTTNEMGEPGGAGGEGESEGGATKETTESEQLEQSDTLFVKNLNFTTKEADLRRHFERIGEVRSVSIPQKKDPKNSSKTLSMGFGFVHYRSANDAGKALRSMQGLELDGHSLKLKVSSKKVSSADQQGTKRKDASASAGIVGTKITVKNLAFEATRQDLRELFGAFGQLKSVRIPRKFDGTHRGFGFVEFLTKDEAKTALRSLSQTHLYGRHLVLEFSEDASASEAKRPNKKARSE